MQQFQRRIQRLEKALIPKERICLVYSREKYKEEDFEKQEQEYVKLHGNCDHVIFINNLSYYDNDLSYDEFIQKSRANCPSNNPLASWWQNNT